MCTLVCPGHMHFNQLCTHDRCKGYWALRFDDGAFGAVPLRGLRALIAFDCPQRMIDGTWTQRLIIDSSADGDQRKALETILLGRAGGPWEKLHAFVGTELPTEFRSIEIADEGVTKRVTIADRLKAFVTQIRGRDKSKPVLFENIFNQIHASSQVIALGDSEYKDEGIHFNTTETHGLFSNFDWKVEAGL
ncbi:MAG TPA: DUF1326 domain-containing protein [Phycisphaerales bacterium]|nr:DUF1326 domain-containing protein [Phycisphaerales bacterium]